MPSADLHPTLMVGWPLLPSHVDQSPLLKWVDSQPSQSEVAAFLLFPIRYVFIMFCIHDQIPWKILFHRGGLTTWKTHFYSVYSFIFSLDFIWCSSFSGFHLYVCRHMLHVRKIPSDVALVSHCWMSLPFPINSIS